MTTREALRAEVLAAPWADLREHHARGGLLLLDAREDLLEAALAIARDDKATVSTLLAGGALRKPSESEAQALSERSQLRFQVLIVQPFVLAQELINAQLS